jgi:hypothetical protein
MLVDAKGEPEDSELLLGLVEMEQGRVLLALNLGPPLDGDVLEFLLNGLGDTGD